MEISKYFWGLSPQGQSVSRYVLQNDQGMEVELSDFGALILAIRLPVKGALRDVTLGFETLEDYFSNDPGFGAYVGRNANRIAEARVTIGGISYPLDENDGKNNLHSGKKRSYYAHYEARCGENAEGAWVEFSRLSPHLEQGFPGNLEQKIRYTLTPGNALSIRYDLQADRETVLNPTNHSYFNLAGRGDILGHSLEIFADRFLPTDDRLIPTGEERSVADTPFDFRRPHTVGERIHRPYPPLLQAGGYDHSYCFPHDGKMKKMAALHSPDGKLSMEVFSDLCAMQVYSGNFLAGEKGKGGAHYDPRSGICFETQFYPNACNTPAFPSPIGKTHKSQSIYRFHF